ncbi:MAG: Gldg family protein [Desulfobacterales bacterium]|nr:Gldg family protein [Desulfobacterales bacterium]
MDARHPAEKYFKFIIYLVVIVLVNLAGASLFYRIDLTENQSYSISRASRKVVSGLSEPLTINVFFTRNLPAPHNNTERYLHDLLEEYALYANSYFNYRFYDVSPEEGGITQKAGENQELARNYGISPVQIRAIEKDEVKFQKAYMGIVLIHGDIIERIPVVTSPDGLEYRITTAVQKLSNKISALLKLSGKIRIKLFLSSSLKAVAPYMRLNDLAGFPEQIEKAVHRLNTKNFGKLAFEYLDPSKDPALEASAEKYNLMNLKWPELSNGKIPAGSGSIGLLMEYGDKQVTIPLIRVFKIPLIGTQYELADINQMEEIINKHVESLIDINEDLGVLASHGTLFAPADPNDPMARQRQDGVTNFGQLSGENYTLKNINLKDDVIPESLNSLVIAGPTENFTDYQLFQIDQFLMRGKNLAIFLDAFKETAPTGQPPMGRPQESAFLPLDTGLEKLLDHYGVRIRKSYVLDQSAYLQQMPPQLGGGEQAIYFAPLIKNRNINKQLEFMKNIKGLITLKVSPLQLDAKRVQENGIKTRQMFSSSANSWEMDRQINLNPMFIRPPEPGKEQPNLPLAYILEGQFPSYFQGKPVPEKTSTSAGPPQSETKAQEDTLPAIDLSKIEGRGGFLSRGKPGKIFVMGSSEMLKDNMLNPDVRHPNTLFIMNIIDFLNNREDIAVMRSKEEHFNPLNDVTAGSKTFVKSFNIAGLPVLVILFGLAVWFFRHARKKRIRMMFEA